MCLDHTKDTCIPTTVARRYAWLQQMVMAALDLACTHAFFPMIPPTPPGSWAWLPSGKFLYINFRPNKKNIYMIFQKNMLPVVSYMLRHQISDILFCLFHPFHRTVLFSHIATAPSQTNMDCVPQQTQPRSMLRVAFFGHPFCSSDKIFIQVIWAVPGINPFCEMPC